MPPLFKKVANARYTTKMLEAISRAKKPLSCIYTKDRRQLGGGRLYVEQAWYEKLLMETKQVKELMLLFNEKGYVNQIQLNCRKKNGAASMKSAIDDPKYTLAHELFHLWQYVEPSSYEKIGTLRTRGPNAMLDPKSQREVWAVRYTNRWRYQEQQCIRPMYGNKKVDDISNY
jgi:hypothetical protein